MTFKNTNIIKTLFFTQLFTLAIERCLYGAEKNYPGYVKVFLNEADKEEPTLATLVRNYFASKARKIEGAELKQLNRAIEEDDKNAIEKILENKVDLNVKYRMKNPLAQAVLKNNVEIAKLLIENGAGVNFIMEGNRSPLSEVSSLEMLNLFLENGAEVELAIGDEAISLLANIIKTIDTTTAIPMIDRLIKPENINGIYIIGYLHMGTLLMAAVLSDNYDMVAHLLEKGANPNVLVKDFPQQPYHTALESAEHRLRTGYKKDDIKKLLIEYGATKIKL